MKIKTLISMGAVSAATFLLATGCGANTTNSQTTGQGGTNQTNTASTTQSTPALTGADFSKLKTTSQQWSKPPAMSINQKKQYDAVVNTNYGSFTIQLFVKDSPKTVNNFVFLADHNFYNNDAFFRIMKTFMVQTGDPKNNGTGGPGYQFKDELPVKHKYQPGIVAMANAGPNTNGSQFFICTGADSESLNQQPNYTQFGQVIKGMSVVQKIASIPVTANPQTGEQSYPTKIAYIKSVNIQVK